MADMDSASARPASRTGMRVAALAALALLAAPADAGVLYKSIGPDGVVQFSDTPPATGVIVEQRPTGLAAAIAPAASASALYPSAGPASNPLVALGDGSADDEALARANAQVDLAEHALALARRGTDVDSARMRLADAEHARTGDDRIAFYEHDLKVARSNLIEMLKSRRTAIAAASADPGAPILGPLRKLASR